MKITNLWINKYKPTNINEIYGNQEQINFIKNNLLNNSNKTFIISGNEGIGKTLIIKLILENLKYNIDIIYPNDIKLMRTTSDFMNDYYNYNNSLYSKILFDQLNKTDINSNKIAIIFNKIENITLSSEKKYIMDIYKENNKIKLINGFPLFFITNNDHSKLSYELKKNCIEIKFNNLTNEEYYKLIMMIANNENISFENNDVIDKLISFSQHDIRRLINLFQELYFHIDNKNNMITNNLINIFINKSREKNINIGLFNATQQILNNYLDHTSIMNLYEIEKVLLPLMIHENYFKKILINNNNNNFKYIIDIIGEITDLLSISDNIETNIYTDQNWFLQFIHGFNTCIKTSYLINHSNNNFIINDKDIKFSIDLNKTSLKNINKKNINNLNFYLNKNLNIKSLFDTLMLNNICNQLVKNNKEQLLINILKKYDLNVNLKNIELCLKIDKTCDIYTGNLKKKYKRIIDNNK
uniref:DNA replication factor RFC1 C-terminal domain-containing protein n=1 Tax=viral metagenome TaxID=1070528 RepID=A0A6C0H7D2_9ZZZZ